MGNAVGNVAFGLLRTRFLDCFGHGPGVGGCLWNGKDPIGRSELLFLAGHGLAGPATGSGIGAGSLSAHRKAHAMATTAHTADVLQALEGHALLAAEVTLDRVGLSGTTKLLYVTVLKILDSDVGIDTSLGENGLGPGRADSVDVSEGDFDPLVAGNVDTSNPCH